MATVSLGNLANIYPTRPISFHEIGNLRSELQPAKNGFQRDWEVNVHRDGGARTSKTFPQRKQVSSYPSVRYEFPDVSHPSEFGKSMNVGTRESACARECAEVERREAPAAQINQARSYARAHASAVSRSEVHRLLDCWAYLLFVLSRSSFVCGSLPLGVCVDGCGNSRARARPSPRSRTTSDSVGRGERR